MAEQARTEKVRHVTSCVLLSPCVQAFVCCKRIGRPLQLSHTLVNRLLNRKQRECEQLHELFRTFLTAVFYARPSALQAKYILGVKRLESGDNYPVRVSERFCNGSG